MEYLKNKGAKVVIGDSPGGQYNKSHLDHIYKITKMNETGAELNYNFNIKRIKVNRTDRPVMKLTLDLFYNQIALNYRYLI